MIALHVQLGKGLNKQPVLDDGMTQTEPDKGWDYSPRDRLAGIKQAIAKRKGKVSGVLLSTLKTKIDDDMKIIALPGFENVQRELQRIADKNADWFPLGFNGIHAVSNPELFAGFNPDKAVFYISVADELVHDFSPAKELQLAVEKMTNGQALTFNNEYAVETLWHEIVHGITGIAPTRYPINKELLEEGVVQWIARHSYSSLVGELGGKTVHQARIIEMGLSYPQVTSNLLSLFAMAELDTLQLTNDLLKTWPNWKLFLIDLLAKKIGLKPKDISAFFNYAERLSNDDFNAKISVKLRNVRRNKDAL